jgi:hypothetical protein
VFECLVETSPLDADEAAALYAAACRDVASAVERSGGDLLVNYRPADALPPDHRPADAERAVRDAIEPALDAPDAVRYEVQVGETFAGRAGNAVTHLLDEEETTTAAIVEPSAALLTRQAIDTAAMKLRRHPVVLGPATRGRVYYAGFREPIDFGRAWDQPATATLVDRAGDAGLEVDFLPYQPVAATGEELAELAALVRAREAGGRLVPEHTAGWLSDAELTVVRTDTGLGLERGRP